MSLFVLWYFSSLMTDSVFLWIISNFVLLWPLVYMKKRVEIDNLIGLINLKLDENIDKIHFLKKFEAQKKEDSKKN